jgi:hypothetical protein
MENPFHGKLTQPIAREQPARDIDALPAETFQMTEHLVTPSHTKSRQNTEAILNTYGLSIHEDLCNINHPFCKNVLKMATPKPVLRNAFLKVFFYRQYRPISIAHDA